MNNATFKVCESCVHKAVIKNTSRYEWWYHKCNLVEQGELRPKSIKLQGIWIYDDMYSFRKDDVQYTNPRFEAPGNCPYILEHLYLTENKNHEPKHLRKVQVLSVRRNASADR